MKRALFLLAFVPLMAHADDFGAWAEIGATKMLPHNLSLGLEGELRMRDASSKVDRLAIGGSLGYRANKYLKVAVGYTFMESYKDGKTSKEEYDTDGQLLAYRLLPSYWKPRHRLNFEASTSVKLWKWLRISLRERYQFTHQGEFSVGRYDYELDPSTGLYDREEAKAKTFEGENTHILRSRLKLSVDKKRLRWGPFISCERQHYLGQSMKLKRVRAAAGTDYKINKHNSIGLAYVFTCDTDDDNARRHAISIGYDIKF